VLQDGEVCRGFGIKVEEGYARERAYFMMEAVRFVEFRFGGCSFVSDEKVRFEKIFKKKLSNR
jgi:hypothetical protein